MARCLAEGNEAMSRLRLKYVHSFVDHDGGPRHYVRRKGYKLTSLPGV